jgi:hypothetical protein
MSYARKTMIYLGESSSVSQEESAPEGDPGCHWEDGVEEDVARLGCRNWKIAALNRKEWKKLLREAEAHPGL